MVNIVLGYDAIHSNIGHLPEGQAAGYLTGSPDVIWTAEDWASHPGAVRIDQSPADTPLDETADVLDYENGAATLPDVVPWAKAAAANYKSAARPGQRSPALYVSADNVTEVVNALVAGAVTGVGLWIANWGLLQSQAETLVSLASGPFPVIGVQYHNAGDYDESIFSTGWLSGTSEAPASPPVPAVTYAAVDLSLPQLTSGVMDVNLPHWYVHRVQALLNGIWGQKLTADGIYGPATAAAVQALQGRYGLTQDGTVGPQTWSLLIAGKS